MKYIGQVGIILAVSFLGELFHTLLPLPVPSSIYGLLLLFSLLQAGIVKLGDVRESGYFLIEIMPMMFIPSAVGLLESWDAFQGMLIPFGIITVITTIAVMVISGRVTQTVIQIRKPLSQWREN